MIRKLLVLLLILGGLTATAQNMVYSTTRKPMPGDEIAMQQPGKITNGESPNYQANSKDKTLLALQTKHTDKMVALVKEAFPNPVGFDISYTRQTVFQPKGMVYTMTFDFSSYGVVKEISPKQTFVKKLETGEYLVPGGSGPELFFKINDPNSLFSSGITLDLDGRSAYMTFPVQGKWKGCIAYGSRFFSDEALTGNGVTYLCISRPGESPFISFTRKEFLQATLNKYDQRYAKDTAEWNKLPNYDQRQLEEAKRTGKPGNEISKLQTNVRNTQLRAGQGMKRSTDEWQANKKVILTYMASTPADSLALPALLYSFRDGTDVKEWFNPKKPVQDPMMYVVPNPAYWHNTPDKTTPQLIVMKMTFSTQHWKDYEIKKQIVANFPVEKFQALLDK